MAFIPSRAWYIGASLSSVISKNTTHPLEYLHREGVLDAHIPPRVRAELLMDDIRHEHKRRFPLVSLKWSRAIINGILNGAPRERIELLSAYAPMDQNDTNDIFIFMVKHKEPEAYIRSFLLYFDPNTALRCQVSAWCFSTLSRRACEAVFGHIGTWDVSEVTDMSHLFSAEKSEFNEEFNEDISGWNVSNVTDMSHMFFGARSFNQPLVGWDVSNVTDMSGMFEIAYEFNQNIGGWDVSNVTDMSYMFRGADSFNQPIGEWNMSNVTDMSYMFLGAELFNQPIGGWDVSNVTSMRSMFQDAISFNQDVGRWNVSSVTEICDMFLGAESFDQSLDTWNVSRAVEAALYT